MPARVHAFLVVRPDGRTPAALHLRRTLAALAAQTRPVDALTIVLCGPDAALREIAASSGAEGVITAPHGTGFAAALALATPRLQGDAVWLLAQDTAPEPDVLVRLAGALELSPSVAVVAPKLVRWDDRAEIVSLGVSMNRFGATVGLADDEFDQGQHDGDEDVLGSDVRGVLVRSDAWRELRGLDPALAGADEGLDLGVRARLAGGRVSLVPAARVAVAGDGVAGVPAQRRRGRRRYAVRRARLHRRLAYAPAAAVPLHWLSLLPLALVRTVTHLVGKQPGRVWPEWAATFVTIVALGAVARARGRIRAARRTGWSRLAALRVGRAQLRLRLRGDGGDAESPVRGELRFFSGGGAWAVLGALAVSVAAFPSLLAWPALGGGALAPLAGTVGRLWADAAYGARSVGLDLVAPADPFAAVVAAIGTLSPAAPSRALVVLWLLALPLAVLGGWFAATRVTDRSLLRIVGGLAWALAPTFLTALVDGRPTGVIVHLLLPWLFLAGSAAHRSWGAAGAASLLLAAVLACAPSLAPAGVLLWVIAIVLTAVLRRGRGLARVIWMLVPSVIVFGPLVWHQLHAGAPWGLLADPGVIAAAALPGADPAGRALLAAGFPTADPLGWGAFLGLGTWWAPLFTAPVAVLTLLALLTPRWIGAAVLVVVAAAGITTALAAPGIAVAFDGAEAVALWPGAALSLAWAGLLGGALIALDVGLGEALAPVRPVVALAVLAGLAVLAVPAFTATARGALGITNGPEATLPAYVAAEGLDEPDVATLVLRPEADGLVARVVRGGTETLGGQSTVLATRTTPDPADAELAALVADLVTPRAADVVDALAGHGITFVFLEPDTGAADASTGLRLAAVTALESRDGLQSTRTLAGDLWAVSGDVAPRAEPTTAQQGLGRGIVAAQLGAVLVALLLSVPTAASRRAARSAPRVVGLPRSGGAA